MNQFSDQLPVNAAEQLCAMALQSFSEDDITVLVVEQIIKQRQFDWATMYIRFNVVIAAGLLLALSVLLWLAWGQI
jgi:serine/threonine protein phosphatase PrpC